MTEIEFRPIKKIVIIEELKYSSTDDFFKDAAAGKAPDVPIPQFWADGVVLEPLPFPPESEEIIKNMMQGTVYVQSVGYAKMDRYKEEISFGRNTFKIIKVTSPTLMNLVKKLKERL